MLKWLLRNFLKLLTSCLAKTKLMSSGLLSCQKCGHVNQYAKWVDGSFESFDRLVCSKCGFLMYDKEKDYLTRKKEYEDNRSK